MQIYREAIDKCGFLDLGFTGSQFAWQKHFVAGHSVWEMLDHGFVTNDWLLQFVESKVHHLSCNTSDHSPLWMVPRNWKIFVSLNHSTLKKCGSLTEDVLKQWKPCCLVLTMMVQLFGQFTKLKSVAKLCVLGIENAVEILEEVLRKKKKKKEAHKLRGQL